MTTLNNKIDFAVILCVNKANPNGDPLDGNRPRRTYEGLGEISDVCLKRKIRNRLMHRFSELKENEKEGQAVFVQSEDNKLDEYRSLKDRAEDMLGKEIFRDNKKLYENSCKTWIDVRAFGQVFPFKGSEGKAKKAKEADAGTGGESQDELAVSVGVRGPVSIHSAFSVTPVDHRIASLPITKSVNLEGDSSKKKGSDTMGMKHRVDHGVYVFFGSMNPQLATKTGFSDKDAEAIKEALRTLFKNDESSARPAGSMEVHKVYWWKHNSKNGQYSSAKVHRTVATRIRVKDGVADPKTIGDYDIPEKSEIDKDLPGLKCEVLDGE
jgi:CRISPR-associated protein Csd2